MVRARLARAVLAASVVVLLHASADGDWVSTDGHKMHFPQEADLHSDTGLAVYDVAPMRLADDWQCSESGAVTGIHVWVSWKGDYDTSLAGADLTIRGDDGTVPGGELWSRSFTGEEIVSQGWAVNPDGLWWYDPVSGDVQAADHVGLLLLNFSIDAAEAFNQTQGQYYWLEVSLGLDEQATEQVGWSTTRDSYGDGAVWWDDQDSTWRRLKYPAGHPWAQQEMDLAFVIVPEPATLLLLTAGAAIAAVRRRTA
ncbi:MAG: PEP-CTERM sorting domain-containing protein [Phycisphaerae bacterium]